jgi:hypothetical protein
MPGEARFTSACSWMSVYPVLQILLARLARVRTAQSRLDWHGLKLVLMEYCRVPSLNFMEGSSYTGFPAQPASMDTEAKAVAITFITLTGHIGVNESRIA